MKIWKKIVIINLIITLAIMSFFTCTALPYLHGVTENVEYQEYQKPLPICCAIAEAEEYSEPLKFRVHIGVPINESDLGYSGKGWVDYVEVYGKVTNNSYILLANYSRGQAERISCWMANHSEYVGYGYEFNREYDNNSYNFKPLTISSTYNYSHPIFQGNYVFDIPDECWQDYQNGYDKVYVNDYGYAVMVVKESDREYLNFTGYYYEKTDSRVYVYDSTKMDWILRPDENGTSYDGYFPLVIFRAFVRTNLYYNYHTLDVYAIGYFTKIEITYYDVICYGYLISQLEQGLLFSAIAFVVVWVLVFIVWVIAYHIIGFIKWLKI